MPKRCSKCKKAKAKSQYHKMQWKLEEGEAVCADCERKRCGGCNKLKLRADFALGVWEMADGSKEHVCKTCVQGKKQKGMWTCANKRCKRQLPRDEAFKIAISRHGDNVRGNSRVCDACIKRHEAEVDAMTKRSLDQVAKKPRAE